VNKIAVNAAPVNTDMDVSAGGFSLQMGDGEYLPIVKVQPVYPRRALSRGIEGYVIIEFTVTERGMVKDVRVVESSPETDIFHQAAVDAALKFKYKPRVIDGQPVEVAGVRNKISFRLER
jgi:protein TonB